MTGNELKAAEIGILTYQAIVNEETPRYEENTMIFKSPINLVALKTVLRKCADMDMETAEVRFEQ